MSAHLGSLAYVFVSMSPPLYHFYNPRLIYCFIFQSFLSWFKLRLMIDQSKKHRLVVPSLSYQKYLMIFDHHIMSQLYPIRIAIVALISLLLLCTHRAGATPPREMSHRDSVFVRQLRIKFEGGLEYIVPYDASRQIRTVSINLYPGVQLFQRVHLSLHAGITATYAWGNIIQWDQNFQNVTYQTAAFGIGPGILIRFEPLIVGRFSLSVDVAEKLLFYTAHFPAGGDIYNFMSSLGGSICYRVSKRDKVSFGGRWMHVSNGQGLNQHNPSYEGAGVNLSVIHYF